MINLTKIKCGEGSWFIPWGRAVNYLLSAGPFLSLIFSGTYLFAPGARASGSPALSVEFAAVFHNQGCFCPLEDTGPCLGTSVGVVTVGELLAWSGWGPGRCPGRPQRTIGP